MKRPPKKKESESMIAEQDVKKLNKKMNRLTITEDDLWDDMILHINVWSFIWMIYKRNYNNGKSLTSKTNWILP